MGNYLDCEQVCFRMSQAKKKKKKKGQAEDQLRLWIVLTWQPVS